jgi:hypothetical protein
MKMNLTPFSAWRPFDDGGTTGQRGSEDGIIIRDEEHEFGARITLERECAHSVPFAVTCGIYGWFFHTRLLGSETEAEFEAMKEGLSAILQNLPQADDPALEPKSAAVCESIQAFVTRFP